MRFFGPLRELSHEMAARLTQIDYDREMAFLLLDGDTLLGVGRLAADPGFEQAEFALIVATAPAPAIATSMKKLRLTGWSSFPAIPTARLTQRISNAAPTATAAPAR